MDTLLVNHFQCLNFEQKVSSILYQNVSLFDLQSLLNNNSYRLNQLVFNVQNLCLKNESLGIIVFFQVIQELKKAQIFSLENLESLLYRAISLHIGFLASANNLSLESSLNKSLESLWNKSLESSAIMYFYNEAFLLCDLAKGNLLQNNTILDIINNPNYCLNNKKYQFASIISFLSQQKLLSDSCINIIHFIISSNPNDNHNFINNLSSELNSLHKKNKLEINSFNWLIKSLLLKNNITRNTTAFWQQKKVDYGSTENQINPSSR